MNTVYKGLWEGEGWIFTQPPELLPTGMHSLVRELTLIFSMQSYAKPCKAEAFGLAVMGQWLTEPGLFYKQRFD